MYIVYNNNRPPLKCSCEDVDQIDEIHIDDITEKLYVERYTISYIYDYEFPFPNL